MGGITGVAAKEASDDLGGRIARTNMVMQSLTEKLSHLEERLSPATLPQPPAPTSSGTDYPGPTYPSPLRPCSPLSSEVEGLRDMATRMCDRIDTLLARLDIS